MGIVKLFSKHREKNARGIPLKYDQRRHSSMSFFTQPPSINSVSTDDNTRNRLSSENNVMRKSCGSTLMINTSSMLSKKSMGNPTNSDIQKVPEPSHKSVSKHSSRRFSQHSKKRSSSKALSMYDVQCTCDMPHSSNPNRNRISAPILDTVYSNKYEYSFKEKLDQDQIKSRQPSILKDIAGIDNTLYSELLCVQQLLKVLLIKSTPQIQKPVEQVLENMGFALEMASSLESRLKIVIEVSEQTILDKAEQIKRLESQRQSEKATFDSTLEENSVMKNKLKEIDEMIDEIEYLLLESQIEPTKEEGGTLLQRIESILAISTASSLLNEKLELELESSDTRVRELIDERTELYSLVEDSQKLKREKELCRLQTKIYDLEENVVYLTNQLDSSKETIRRLRDENLQLSRQFLDSDSAFRKMIDTQFSNKRVKTDTVQYEHNHFEKMAEQKEKDSCTAWEEAYTNRLQLDGYKYKSDRSSFMELHQSNIKEQKEDSERQMNNYQSDTTELRSRLEKTNDSVKYQQYNLVNQSNDSIEYIIESKRRSLNRFISANQYNLEYSQNTIENNNKDKKRLDWVQDMENDKIRQLGVNAAHKDSKSKNDVSLNIQKEHFNMNFMLPQNGNMYAQKCKALLHHGTEYPLEEESKNQMPGTLYPVNACSSITSDDTLKNAEHVQSVSNELKYTVNSTGIIRNKEYQSILNVESMSQTRGEQERNVKPLKFDSKIFKKDITPIHPINDLSVNKEHLPESVQSTGPQYENDTFLELLGYLQNKNDSVSIKQGLSTRHDHTLKEGKSQEELMKIHTRAQLGLLEYLEGESNVSLALLRFRKQLENEMNELNFETT